MNREEVINIAKKAGDDVEHTLPSDLDFLERFASLVAAAEREECSKVCDDATDGMGSFKWMAHHCAAAIRARGEK